MGLFVGRRGRVSRAWLLVLIMVFSGGLLIGAAVRRDGHPVTPRPSVGEIREEEGLEAPGKTEAPPSQDASSLFGPAPVAKEGDLSRSDEDPFAPERPDGEGLICLVIDDCGFNVDGLRRLVDVAIPMTFAILPRERHSLDVAALLEARGFPAILHLPMEAEGDGTRGDFLVGVAMSDDVISETVAALLDEMPTLVGVNNHRGSRATADERVMEAVLKPLAERGLLFLDSRTSSTSVAFRTARRMGLKTAYNSIFLDHEATLDFMKSQWLRAQKLARSRGWVVVIGHVRPLTITFFETMDRRLQPGLRFVTLPELLEAVYPR